MRRVFEVEIEVKDSGCWNVWTSENVIAQDAVHAGQIAVRRATARYGKKYMPRAKSVRFVVTLSQ